MEVKERESTLPSVNWTAAIKHLDDLYSRRIKYRDPVQESKERVKAFQLRFGTAGNPDIHALLQTCTQSETDLRTTASTTSKQQTNTPGGHFSQDHPVDGRKKYVIVNPVWNVPLHTEIFSKRRKIYSCCGEAPDAGVYGADNQGIYTVITVQKQ